MVINKKILITYISLFSFSINAEQSNKVDNENLKIDIYKDNMVGYIKDLSVYVDSFFKNPENQVKNSNYNDSYGIISYKQNSFSKNDSISQLDFDLKVELPNSKRKWKLFINSNDSNDDSLEDKTKTTFIDDMNVLEDYEEAIGGFMFSDIKGSWERDFRVGARLNSLDNPFVKVGFRNSKLINKKYIRVFKQEFYYYASDGLGVNGYLKYYTEDDKKDYIYESSSDYQYLESTGNFEYVQKLSLWNQNTPNSSIRYTFGSIVDSDNNFKVKEYWFDAKYTKNIYKNWIFVNLIPEVSYKRIYDFNVEYGFLMEFQFYFVNSKNKRNINYYY
jgi:hypothetical protein